MMIPAGKMQEVQTIMENYREDMEENFVEEFKNWVKDYDSVM